MARVENNTSQQTAQKVMNEQLFYLEFHLRNFQNPNLAEYLGPPTQLFQFQGFSTCRQTSRSWRAPSSIVLVGRCLLFLRPEAGNLKITRLLFYW